MKYIFLFIALIALLASSCKPTCQRWLAKHGHTLRDTVTTYTKVSDTVTVTTQGDTITLREVLRDTVVRSGKASIQLQLDTLWRIKYLRATCDPDTVVKYLERFTPTTTIRETPIVPERIVSKVPWWVWLALSLLSIAVIILILKLIFK
jgi:hypothetical protein